MELKQTEEGKNYLLVTEEEIKNLPSETRVYQITDTEKGIVPPDCKHEFEISSGFPRDIKGCKKCIYWEFA